MKCTTDQRSLVGHDFVVKRHHRGSRQADRDPGEQVPAGVAAAKGAGVEIARRQIQALGVFEGRSVRAIASAGFAVAQ